MDPEVGRVIHRLLEPSLVQHPARQVWFVQPNERL
jgi:hypothetical protein